MNRVIQEPPNTTSRPIPGARLALGLLLAINLFNYIDRQVLAGVEVEIRRAFFPLDPDGAAARTQSGSLASAFLVSYMLTAPLFGALAARWPRVKWKLIGVGVLVWSLATGCRRPGRRFLHDVHHAVFRRRGRRGLRPVGADDPLRLFSRGQAGEDPLVVLRGYARRRSLGLCPGRHDRKTRSAS